MRCKLLNIIALMALCPIIGYGQVTIGSKKVPVHGALLDIKDANASSIAGGITTTKGLGMPRVKLTDQHNLYPMFETVPGNGTANDDYKTDEKKRSEDERHIGLVVYNYDECGLQGQGLYVWEEDGWNKMDGDKKGVGLYVNSSDLVLWNNNPHTLDVVWKPSTLAPPTYTSTGLSLTLDPDPLVDSPTLLSVSAEKFSEAELVANPFAKKSGTLTFTLQGSPCAVGGAPQSKTVKITQMGKALFVNGSQRPKPIVTLNSPGVPGEEINLTILSNARWIAKPSLSLNSRDFFTPHASDQFDTVLGREDNSGDKSQAETVQFKSVLKYHYGGNYQRLSYLVFSDVFTPKRFTDVLVPVYICTTGTGEYIEDLKEQWEEMYGLYPGNEPDSNGNEALNPRKVQWHYDQMKKDRKGRNRGGIFFSAMFGNKRWMTSNLASNVYDTDVIVRPAPIVPAKNTAPEVDPFRWRYPGPFQRYWESDDPKYFNKSKREGMTYSELMATANRKYEQGICPNGWRIPSKTDWEELFDEIEANYTKYSYRDTPLGTHPLQHNKDLTACMMNPCMGLMTATGDRRGKSMDVLHGGFDLILNGLGAHDQSVGSAQIQFATSTPDPVGAYNYMVKILYIGPPSVYFTSSIEPPSGLHQEMNVRCVKND